MVGKKNIVFGFLYLVLTAALGPYMVSQVFPAIGQSGNEKQAAFSELQLYADSDFEKDLEAMSGEDIARVNARALLALNNKLGLEATLNSIKGGPHAHGNLEALLNIAAGLTLGFLTVSVFFKQLISWLFIAGALLHSGILYLVIVFNIPWAQKVLSLGIGPVIILAALLLMGFAAAVGFRTTYPHES